MQLRLKPHHRNTYPLGGLLIRGASPRHWVAELQRMVLSLQTSRVYALPGTLPNSLWGCLVVLPAGVAVDEPGQNEACQVVEELLFIPEHATVYPALADGELSRVLRNVPHLLHPELGFVELIDLIDWGAWLSPPVEELVIVRRPAASVNVPQRARSFRVVPMAPEQVLAELTSSVGEPSADPISQPLSLAEKLKLALLRLLFREGDADKPQKTAGKPTSVPTEPTALSKLLASLAKLVTPKTEWLHRLQANFDKLTERNQKQLDQLLKLLRDNPDLALKYALPLDTDGTARGSREGGGALFNWSVRWLDFSLLGNNQLGKGGGGPTLEEQQFAALQAQYTQTASDFVKQQNHRKAAFVYLNLLKDPNRAAETLEAGKLYQEAAALYLKELKNKQKAAECYERGQMVNEAIDLHKELGNHEKVGDLYCTVNRRDEAMPHYQQVVDGYVGFNQFVKASLLCRQKMDNPTGAQRLLLEGWRKNLDAFNCLNNYFAGLPDESAWRDAIESVYTNEVNATNRESFVQVLRHEFDRKPTLIRASATWPTK